MSDETIKPLVTCKLCDEVLITEGGIKTLLDEKPEIRVAMEKIALKVGGEKGASLLGVYDDKEKTVAEYIKATILHHLFKNHKKYTMRKFPWRRSKTKGWSAINKVMEFRWEELKKHGVER